MAKNDSALAHFGNAVRSQRNAKHFTQEKLAERADLDPNCGFALNVFSKD